MPPRPTHPFSIEYALLGFMEEGPRYGYDLYQEVTDPGGLWEVWRIKQGTLYALLARLEECGYLTAAIEPAEGRPSRKMFTMTESGRTVFADWIRSPVERGRQFRLDLLAKLYFARRRGMDVVEELLEAQRQVCRRWLDGLETDLAQSEEADPFLRLVDTYRAGQVRAMIDWLETCRRELVTQPSIC